MTDITEAVAAAVHNAAIVGAAAGLAQWESGAAPEHLTVRCRMIPHAARDIEELAETLLGALGRDGQRHRAENSLMWQATLAAFGEVGARALDDVAAYLTQREEAALSIGGKLPEFEEAGRERARQLRIIKDDIRAGLHIGAAQSRAMGTSATQEADSGDEG